MSPLCEHPNPDECPNHGVRSRTELTRLERTGDHAVVTWTFTLAEIDARRWERERLDMVEDAIWLLGQAVEGHTEGPLTLPRSHIPVRTATDDFNPFELEDLCDADD